MSTILITTDYLQPNDEVDRLLSDAGHSTVHLNWGTGDKRSQLKRELEGIDAAIVGNDPFDDDVLNTTSSLKAIVRTGVGVDSIDVNAATRNNISVSNLPGINSQSVAEYTIGLILSAARHLVGITEGVKSGTWPRTDGHELRGATLGIIGYGSSARRLIPLAEAFGMRILVFSRSAEATKAGPDVIASSLDQILTASDYVSIHTSLRPDTHHLIDAQALAQMKRTSYLINTARGPIVDEIALVEAVNSGGIAGAALDVVSDEPLPQESPLRRVDGITVYSHMAGQTVEARRAAGIQAAFEALRALEGVPELSLNFKSLSQRHIEENK